ncbi:MAG TPA: glycosyltransferase [Terracidiphilus sp.]|jgi:glycosyltransferase involved in cell wall biosynthesis
MRPGLVTRNRVLLLIPHLGIGGAQRVTATLARHLDSVKYEVHLALITQSPTSFTVPAPEFPASVRIHCLGAKRARYAAFRLIALVRELRPHLVFVGMAHLAPLVPLLRALLPAKTHIILRQNGSFFSTRTALRPRVLSRMTLAIAYRGTDVIICQTQSTAAELHRELHLDHAQLCVLPNPVDIQGIRQACSDASQGHETSHSCLLAVGRHVPEKGFDLLLDAFGAVRRDFPTLRLRIAGSGSCQTALQSQARRLGVEDRIEFLGDVRSPSQYFPDALAFVLSSREDELPNALLEAAAAGLPIIATPASPGIADLLVDHPGVWLARNASASALEKALRDAVTCIRHRERFTHGWVDPFALAPALAAYERLFDRVLNGQGA